jgi:hypothetical protein
LRQHQGEQRKRVEAVIMQGRARMQGTTRCREHKKMQGTEKLPGMGKMQ